MIIALKNKKELLDLFLAENKLKDEEQQYIESEFEKINDGLFVEF